VPIYELYCEECGHEFEKIVPFSAVELPACPACQSEGVGRRMSRPAIHFKGSGWYITDSRKGNGKYSNNGGEHSSEKSESKSSENGSNAESNGTKTETKAETSSSKTESKSSESSAVKAASK
jgi:putative FmdB family regulatory protein